MRDRITVELHGRLLHVRGTYSRICAIVEIGDEAIERVREKLFIKIAERLMTKE